MMTWTSCPTALALALFVTSATPAQLVSVRCFTGEEHLDRFDDCVSGPGMVSRPEACPAAAACVLGFGEDARVAPALCLPGDPPLPSFTRAFQSSWTVETVPIVHECVAKPYLMASLFSVYDDDGDGDVDGSDGALFEKATESPPNLVQSEAVLTYLQCCVAEEVIRNIGRCLSGPGATKTPLLCDGLAACIAGFSEPVQPGDFQFRLCGEPAVLPKPKDAYCITWQDEHTATSFLCPAAAIPGNTQFIVSDSDGDGDVDLFDFAVYQREWESTPN
jgi:hypothetical protein